MSTEYLRLNENRPELTNKFRQIETEEPIKERINNIKVNENKFMNMNLNDIFDKIINILPNMYNDYYEKSLETKLKLQANNEEVTDSDIFRETIILFLFENENIIFLGILVLIIAVFLYIIN